jgi:hypothetical protein
MNNVVTRRARTLEEWGEFAGRMFVEAEIGAALAGFRPRPTDVIISPYAKCGTTWLQQIFHTLRTRGDMDFDDISRVVPWIETSTALGIDINAEQRANPRGFKSHLGYDGLPKGCRYIVSLREPKDALVSFYRFMEGWFIEPGVVPIEAFAQFWVGRPPGDDYAGHLTSWWAVRHDPGVLMLSYEQMTAEPEAAIRKVAAFCGIPLDDELLALTLERSSLAFMLAHKDVFADPMMRRLSEVRCNLPPGSDSAKVRKGGVGGHRDELPPEVLAAVDAMWRKRVTPVTGHADYAALEADLRAGR